MEGVDLLECLPSCLLTMSEEVGQLTLSLGGSVQGKFVVQFHFSLSPSPSSPCYSLEVVLLLILHRIVLVYLLCASSLLPSQVEYGFRTFLRTGMLLESWGILCCFDRGEFKENTFHGKVLMSFTFVSSKK